MLPALLAIACLLAPAQDPGDRDRAEQAARAGHTGEALPLWRRIADADPGDIEAHVWVGRLQLRLGDAVAAEATFRSVLARQPGDVDARIGLGNALVRQGALHEALVVLFDAERDAASNGELLAAIARAFRTAGNDRYALYYYTRATVNAPGDPDIREAYENVARADGQFVAVEGFGQRLTPGSGAGSGRVVIRLRATPILRVLGEVRAQRGDGYADHLYGGGLEWRPAAADTVLVRAAGHPGNVALPHADLSAGLVHYSGPFEVGGSVRGLSFADADVTAASPTLAWDPGGRFRVDARYTYSYARFAATGQHRGDHSVLARGTVRARRRVSLNGAYAYGIESFEDLTADRLASLAAHTAAAGMRITLRSLTVVDAAWERQWRSNTSRLDRVTIALSQFF